MSIDLTHDHPTRLDSRMQEPTLDHQRGYTHDEVTGLPSQMVHVEHLQKLNAFDELPHGKLKNTKKRKERALQLRIWNSTVV